MVSEDAGSETPAGGSGEISLQMYNTHRNTEPAMWLRPRAVRRRQQDRRASFDAVVYQIELPPPPRFEIWPCARRGGMGDCT